MAKGQMTVKLEKGNLVITIPAIMKDCPVSPSGKTRRVASTEGAIHTDVIVEGKPVIVSFNAYISNR